MSWSNRRGAETMKQNRADKLWICQFTEGLVKGTDFHSLMKSVENLPVNYVHVKHLRERTLDLQAFYVRMVCLVAVFRFHLWGMVKKEKRKLSKENKTRVDRKEANGRRSEREKKKTLMREVLFLVVICGTCYM